MNLPLPGDYIDIHTHGATPAPGIYVVENLMVHEGIKPESREGMGYTAGIHPWHLNENNCDQMIGFVQQAAGNRDILAIGEGGFDRLRGPAIELQKKAFEEQVAIAEAVNKPVVIHCVRAWDELLSAHRKLKPAMSWLVHGFRGKKELAMQLISRGMFLSFWFDFLLRPESAGLLKYLPKGRIFLETDGADVEIQSIYRKAAKDMGIPVEELKGTIFDNFNEFFKVYGT